jgi:protein ImuA
LAGLGFPPERLIQVCARDEAEALAVMEDALATVGVTAVVGEVEAADLTAGRRLQLACEKAGATGFLIRRRPYGGTAKREATGSAAATRWRVASAPSEPPAGEFGLGSPRFAVTLERCRGGRTGAWLMEAEGAYELEANDGTHPLRLVAELGDRQLAPALPLRRTAA